VTLRPVEARSENFFTVGCLDPFDSAIVFCPIGPRFPYNSEIYACRMLDTKFRQMTGLMIAWSSGDSAFREAK
jgi:hypothetical protein